MRGPRYRAVLAVLLGALLLVGPAMRPAPTVVRAAGGLRPTAAGDNDAYRSGELLIKFIPGMLAERNQAQQLLGQVGASKAENLSVLGVERWQVPVGQEISLAAKLTVLPGVEYAEPNYVVTAHLTPDDTYYAAYQWPHPMINSPAAWDITTGSSAVVVAVVDTGVDMDNPEFQGRLVGGYDYVNDDSDPDDDNGHGTHVAGIIAAMGNNQRDVAGMAWLTRIMPMKVLNSSGGGFDSDTAEAVKDAADAGADIINISLGGVDYSQTLYNAVRYAYDHDVLVVVSGGNCGPTSYLVNGCTYANQAIYPAAHDTEVFAVAATTESDTVAGFSNRSDYIDIAAPGTNILSTAPGSLVAIANGTSQAAPHVAGLAALLLAVDPTLTSQEIQMHIEAASADLGSSGWDTDYGAGRIDAYATLAQAIDLATPTLYAIDNAGSDTYTVTWGEVDGATAYHLQESTSANFLSTTDYDMGASLSYNAVGQDGGIWYYRVQATRGTITSDWSTTRYATVLPDPPVLDAIVPDADPDAYTLTWSTSTGASGYRLQESANANFTDVITRYVGANTSYHLTGQPGGTWTYRVEAANAAGFSAPSNSRSFTVTVPLIPTPALNPILNPDSNRSYTVSWTTVLTATDYILEESNSPWFDVPMPAYTTAPVTQVTVLDQQPGLWHYRVRAQTSSGNSPWSALESVTVLAHVFLPIVMR